jgi:hypothetical protein
MLNVDPFTQISGCSTGTLDIGHLDIVLFFYYLGIAIKVKPPVETEGF